MSTVWLFKTLSRHFKSWTLFSNSDYFNGLHRKGQLSKLDRLQHYNTGLVMGVSGFNCSLKPAVCCSLEQTRADNPSAGKIRIIWSNWLKTIPATTGTWYISGRLTTRCFSWYIGIAELDNYKWTSTCETTDICRILSHSYLYYSVIIHSDIFLELQTRPEDMF